MEKLRAICGELENQIKDLEAIQVETEAKEVEWENVRYLTILHLLCPSTCIFLLIFEPWHEISNNVVCATGKASDQPAHMRSLIRAFASRLYIL